MQRQGDTLLVLTRNVLGGADSELRQFDAQTLAPLGEEAVSRETTGLGLALDGGVLLCDDTGLCTMDMQTGQTQVVGFRAGAWAFGWRRSSFRRCRKAIFCIRRTVRA